jgi:hypothetical protein
MAQEIDSSRRAPRRQGLNAVGCGGRSLTPWATAPDVHLSKILIRPFIFENCDKLNKKIPHSLSPLIDVDHTTRGSHLNAIRSTQPSPLANVQTGHSGRPTRKCLLSYPSWYGTLQQQLFKKEKKLCNNACYTSTCTDDDLE